MFSLSKVSRGCLKLVQQFSTKEKAFHAAKPGTFVILNGGKSCF